MVHVVFISKSHSLIYTHIYTSCLYTALFLSHTIHMPNDTSAFRLEEPGIEPSTFRLLDDVNLQMKISLRGFNHTMEPGDKHKWSIMKVKAFHIKSLSKRKLLLKPVHICKKCLFYLTLAQQRNIKRLELIGEREKRLCGGKTHREQQVGESEMTHVVVLREICVC